LAGLPVRIFVLSFVCYACGASTARAQEPATSSNRAVVVWTIGGTAGGFGIGLWAGLTAFDDAINSDRKVWTSAIAGAAAGAVGGYLIGRALREGPRSNATRSARRVLRFVSAPAPASAPYPFDARWRTRLNKVSSARSMWHFAPPDSRLDAGSVAQLPQCSAALP
jgi:hypothetical protein